MLKQAFIYSGKSKTLYATDNPQLLWLEYRDDATAFNGVKKASLPRKGLINNYFNSHFMSLLESKGIKTHFVKQLSETEALVKKMEMIPIEFVVRNRVAGSLSKRLGLEEGTVLREPVLEFFFKSDPLGDPMINESHIHVFEWAQEDEMLELKERSLQINQILQPFFEKAGLCLVDFKLEFGRFFSEGKKALLLGDEFTLDGSRVWDVNTLKKFDKDRFRRDLGEVLESYQEAAKRLGIHLPV